MTVHGYTGYNYPGLVAACVHVSDFDQIFDCFEDISENERWIEVFEAWQTALREADTVIIGGSINRIRTVELNMVTSVLKDLRSGRVYLHTNQHIDEDSLSALIDEDEDEGNTE